MVSMMAQKDHFFFVNCCVSVLGTSITMFTVYSLNSETRPLGKIQILLLKFNWKEEEGNWLGCGGFRSPELIV